MPESGGVGGVGGVEGGGSCGADLGGGAVVDRCWGVQADAGVAVDVVVVIEEHGAERAGVLDRAEPAGERRAVLERLELGLAVGVVVGHVRAAVGAGDTEIDEELGDGLGGHRRATVGVQGELITVDTLAVMASSMNSSASSPVSAAATHPADDVAGEDVDDHEQLVVDAPLGAVQLGDVPRPHLVRSRAISSGLLRAGWVRCRRRSRFSPAIASSRYIVEIEHR